MVKVLCDCCGKECSNSEVYKLPRVFDEYITDKSGKAKMFKYQSIKALDSNLCENCKRKISIILAKLNDINMVGYKDSEITITFSI